MRKSIVFISKLLSSLWLFFPGLIFIIIGFIALTKLDQGKDLIVASVESFWSSSIFLLAICFWALVMWYSSRLVSTVKLKKQSFYSDLEVKFYRVIPRYLGIGCFVIMQIAILNQEFFQISYMVIILLILTINSVMILIGAALIKYKQPVYEKKPFVFFVFIVGIIFILLIISMLFISCYKIKLIVLFGGISVTGLFFYNFVYFRRILITNTTKVENISFVKSFKENKKNFLIVFSILTAVGIIIYATALYSPQGSQFVGSLNFTLTAFAILLFIGNSLAMGSIKCKINLHFIVFFILFLIGLLYDPYEIKGISIEQTNFKNRITLNEYFENWFYKNNKYLNDTVTDKRIPVYFSLADGGASRSGYWVAQVLGTLEDSIGISNHLFCISGASGGTVGNIAYYNLLHQKKPNSYRDDLKKFLSMDFLTFTLSRLLSPFYFLNDRGWALERALEHGDKSLSKPFSEYIITKDSHNYYPILYVNVTRMQDSHPALISNIQYPKEKLNYRLDVLDQLDEINQDIRLSTVAILSSRFPYVSPAGGIGRNYYVDGGYFDNSGAGAVHETIIAFEEFLKSKNDKFLDKVEFKIIHISNTDLRKKNYLKRVNPIVNDLVAPIKVLAASYGQQTEINTLRLMKYIENKAYFKKSSNWFSINLHKNTDTRSYSMSWYMSEDCRNRIDSRLEEEILNTGVIGNLITDFKQYCMTN